MKLLVIGGTQFSGRALTGMALERGDEVTIFHRGSGTDVHPEAEHVHGDRDEGVDALPGRTFDAVVDTCGYVPRAVRASTELLADSAWYGYISSISAHLEGLPPGATEDSPTHQPPWPDSEEITWESYGPLKAACEEVVREGFGDRGAVIRPGYIVGPFDPTDRFTSWLRRASEGGTMLAPGPADEPVQFVDARDLAAFVLHLADTRTGGTFNVVHPSGTTTIGEVLEAAKTASGADTQIEWVDADWLLGQLGDDRHTQLPIWEPEDAGAHRYDSRAAVGHSRLGRSPTPCATRWPGTKNAGWTPAPRTSAACRQIVSVSCSRPGGRVRPEPEPRNGSRGRGRAPVSPSPSREIVAVFDQPGKASTTTSSKLTVNVRLALSPRLILATGVVPVSWTHPFTILVPLR